MILCPSCGHGLTGYRTGSSSRRAVCPCGRTGAFRNMSSMVHGEKVRTEFAVWTVHENRRIWKRWLLYKSGVERSELFAERHGVLFREKISKAWAMEAVREIMVRSVLEG